MPDLDAGSNGTAGQHKKGGSAPPLPSWTRATSAPLPTAPMSSRTSAIGSASANLPRTSSAQDLEAGTDFEGNRRNRSAEWTPSKQGGKKLKGKWPQNRLKFKTWQEEIDIGTNDLVHEVLTERGWKFDVKGNMCDPDNLDDLLNVARRTDYCLWWIDEEEAKIIIKCRKNHRVNCIPGMSCAGKKTTFSLLPGVRNSPWYPETLVLPQDTAKARAAVRSQEPSLWIVKPMTGWAGHDIIVYRSDQPEFAEFVEAHAKKRNVIQRYIDRPMLIDGLKFHFRIYTLIESLNPLRIFLNTGALHVWFASQPYTNAQRTLGRNFNPFIHLTNRSVNIERNPDGQSDITREKPHLGKCIEMTADAFYAYVEEHYGKERGRQHLWDQAKEICRHTMHAMAKYKKVQEMNEHAVGKLSNRSFELFGVDIMMDADLKLWLCEVNSSPGLGSCPKVFGNGEPNPLYNYYCNVRRGVIHDTMRLLGLDSCPKGSIRNWTPLYCPNRILDRQSRNR